MTSTEYLKRRFVNLYAVKLKEFPHTPYSQLDIRELERHAERYLEAMLASLQGDRKPLERFVKLTLLSRGQAGFRAWHILQAFDAGRDFFKALTCTPEEFAQLDDALHWAMIKFSQLYEEVQTERGLAKMVESLTLALEAKESYTSSHSQSVQRIGEKIAKLLGVHIGMAGLFHDVGKIYIPDAILCKTTPLTPQEWEVIKQHPYHSFRIVSPIAPAAGSVCLRHHERPDGRGYPIGEPNPPIEANVIAAADTIHAICSKRYYNNSHKLDIALAQVRAGRGTQFYPAVVDAVARAYGDMSFLLTQLRRSAGKLSTEA